LLLIDIYLFSDIKYLTCETEKTIKKI
jgi:hypothetical protein